MRAGESVFENQCTELTERPDMRGLQQVDSTKTCEPESTRAKLLGRHLPRSDMIVQCECPKP